MKKSIIWIIFIAITALLITLPIGIRLYLKYFHFEEGATALTSTNSAVQIGYNILYLIIALSVLLVAYYQLTKTREATTIQTLSTIDNYIRSDSFLVKRKSLAEYVSKNGVNVLSEKLKSHRNKSEKFTEEESKEIAKIKNIFEDVIYQFEFVGYYYSKGIFNIEDVYQLFSIELQQYWLLMEDLKFIEYLRENKHNPIKDYYDKFEKLFIDTIRQEIRYDLPFFQKHIHCSETSYKKKTNNLILKKRRILDQFLVEEANLNT